MAVHGPAKKEFTYVGKRLSNDNALGKVTGTAEYCGDTINERTLHLRLKAGTITHGRILSVDTSEAEKMPGVKAVYHAFNTPDKTYDRGRVAPYENMPFQEKLFDTHIRYMGERVAAVVADTEAHAAKACDAIKVEYETYPAAVTMAEAMAEGAPQLFEKGNIYHTPVMGIGDYDACEGDLITKTESHFGRMSCLCMETHTARARYDRGNKKLTVWTGCQTSFGIRSTLGDFLDMPYSKVRVIKPLMGGSFGCKQETIVEPLAAYAAKDLCADVILTYTREEEMNNNMLKHNLDWQVESKVTKDGIIKGLDARLLMDAGAYTTISESYARTACGKSGKVYRIPNLRVQGTVVNTNTTVNGSFRSWGSSEWLIGCENHMNQVAKELGMDPIEFRLKNVHKPYELEPIHKCTVGDTHFEECLMQGRDAFRWEERKKECAEKNASQSRYRYGVGMAVGSHTSSFYPYMADMGCCTARINEDGSLILRVAVHDHGCGTVMAMKKIAAEVLEMDLERVDMTEADTDNCRYDYGCYASRTVYVLGSAVKKCCEELLEKARSYAAEMFRTNYSHIRYEAGEFFQETDPANRITMAEVACFCLEPKGVDLFQETTIQSFENPGVDCAHFAEVKVDTLNGMVSVEHYLAVHDIGKAINPDLCIGQIGSGIQQGIGNAICEDAKIDPKTGQLLIQNLKDYEVANACDMPDYDVLFIEDGDANGPFGAKSIGEVVVAPVAPCITAAVNNALDTELRNLPLSPAKILEALEGKEA